MAIYGASIREQIAPSSAGPTSSWPPGRLLDLLGRDNILDLSRVRVVVLDEADEMLNMGFQEDLTSILSATPDNKRTWLFSATMGREVRIIAKRYMHGTEELQVANATPQPPRSKHQYTVVHSRDRYGALKRFVDADPDLFAIVFCRAPHEDPAAGHPAGEGRLRGRRHPRRPEPGAARPRDGPLPGSAPAAADRHRRGRARIDVNDVTRDPLDLPNEAEATPTAAAHRARPGVSGISLSIIGVRERRKVQQLERMLKTHFTRARTRRARSARPS